MTFKKKTIKSSNMIPKTPKNKKFKHFIKSYKEASDEKYQKTDYSKNWKDIKYAIFEDLIKNLKIPTKQNFKKLKSYVWRTQILQKTENMLELELKNIKNYILENFKNLNITPKIKISNNKKWWKDTWNEKMIIQTIVIKWCLCLSIRLSVHHYFGQQLITP